MPAAQMTVTSPRTGNTFVATAIVAHAAQRIFTLVVAVRIPGNKIITARANVAPGRVVITGITVPTVDCKGFVDEVALAEGKVRDMVVAGVGYMWGKMEVAAVAHVEAALAAHATENAV